MFTTCGFPGLKVLKVPLPPGTACLHEQSRSDWFRSREDPGVSSAASGGSRERGKEGDLAHIVKRSIPKKIKDAIAARHRPSFQGNHSSRRRLWQTNGEAKTDKNAATK